MRERLIGLIEGLRNIRGVQAIILFGSYARGEEKPTSDIDVCVLADRDIPGDVKSDIVSRSSEKVDVTLFWDMPPAVRYAILREGRMLHQEDAEAIQTATVETMGEYLDFKHIMDRNVARMLA